ncbi:MAG TPA: hypothetical protein VFY93_17965 [Planctomycetota bacterium]|nr:hypothetical protein [Planctomycetota bacterium]
MRGGPASRGSPATPGTLLCRERMRLDLETAVAKCVAASGGE